jgi:hypothetical protein
MTLLGPSVNKGKKEGGGPLPHLRPPARRGLLLQ